MITGDILVGILIPFFGTTLGAGMVLFLKGRMKPWFRKLMLGFASGVMIAASVWSLLLPAIAKSGELGAIPWLPPAVGFLAGMGFLLLLDTFIPHMHQGAKEPEGLPSHARKNTMLMLAVTLHNIPEGMAVGVVYAGLALGEAGITWASALALSIGIALQNIPEGAIISLPLRSSGMSKPKALWFGTFSGLVEPVAAIITIYLTSVMVPILPYLLAFAAGAMIYVVVEELIPGLQEDGHSNIGIIGVALGFTVMMILDVALG
ncbi:MAG: ZIP family metal transporter [Eubacteriales bacterium]|nr:ZIP family metal transporter [Eubacteriales bacterium]